MLDFMENDILGIIANLHSKIADTSRYAIKDKLWLELSKMHSLAVDYQKNGELPDVNRIKEIQRIHKHEVDYLKVRKIYFFFLNLN